MGTRSLTHIKDSENRTLVTIYRQFDGYPTGHGDDMKRILNDGVVTLKNGYHLSDESPTVFNGMGCMAAYLIGELKEGIGNIYIVPIPTENDDPGWEEYVYTLYPVDTELCMKVWDVHREEFIFSDRLRKFDGETVEQMFEEE